MTRAHALGLVVGTAIALAAACAPPAPPPHVAHVADPPPPASSAPAAVASAPAASSSAAPPPRDPCALAQPKVVVARKELVAAFDVGPDGKLAWVEYDPMKTDADVMSLDLGKDAAAPEHVAHVDLRGHPGGLVAGREGFWLSVDGTSVCSSTVAWLGREAKKVVPIGGAGCVSGPVRTRNGAEALWVTTKGLLTEAGRTMVAKGPPPGGVAAFPVVKEPSLDGTFLARDGMLVVGDHGEVFLLRPDGTERLVLSAKSDGKLVVRRAVAAHGDDVYLATGSSPVTLVRVPMAGGAPTMKKTFDVAAEGLELFPTARGVVMLVRGKQTDHMLLVDASGTCADAELELPDRRRQVVVEGDAVWVLRKSEIVRAGLGGR